MWFDHGSLAVLPSSAEAPNPLGVVAVSRVCAQRRPVRAALDAAAASWTMADEEDGPPDGHSTIGR